MNTPEERFTPPAEEPITSPPAESSDESLPVGGRARALAVRWPGVAVAAALLLLAGLVAIVYSLVSGGGRPLYPNLPTFTPVGEVVAAEPALLTFTELNADPNAYRDKRVQVAGNFASVAATTCVPYSGPPIRWSLVAEDLQLNAVGFENVLRLLNEGTPMTVTGIWRLYSGPVGCGKAPDNGNVWFLEVDRIIEPNPLFGSGAISLTVVPGSPLSTLPPLELEPPTPEATPSLPPTETLTATATLPATATLALQATVTITTNGTSTTTTTATLAGTLLAGTATTTGTPTLTVTPGPSPTPSATGGADQTTTPGIPTATLSSTGYPPTLEGYP